MKMLSMVVGLIVVFLTTSVSTGDITDSLSNRSQHLAVNYLKSDGAGENAQSLDVDLNTLINLAKQENLVFYLNRLQAFQSRVSASDSLIAARNWLVDMFKSFICDSVYIDRFYATLGIWYRECYNIVITKTGTKYPDLQIVVGAHYDGNIFSPAVDDNGSGIAGVLEIAHVLADIETDMTIVFIAFDAGVWDQQGSEHYAHYASLRNDRIALMFNMDMIGNYPNDSSANLYYAANSQFAQTWIDLAAPLVGIDGVLAGSTYQTDHAPFAAYGYDVVSLEESIPSAVAGIAQDSTTYINFDYLTRMVRASLGTIYYLSNGDFDGDGVPNDSDNCIISANPLQLDSDGDSVGDKCDNCVDVYNPNQEDDDGDDIGDHCDGKIHIINDELPTGYKGVPYIFQFTAIGGTEPYDWSKIAGDLPIGCVFNGGTVGTITGTPNWSSTYFFTVMVTDSGVPQKTDTLNVSITVIDPPYICGDVNGDGEVLISDVVFLSNYIFLHNFPQPDPLESSDVDCNEIVEISDVIYLNNFIFGNGPVPCADCPFPPGME